MADKVTIDIEARFHDYVTGKTKSADESVEKLGKTAEKTQKKLNDLGKNTRKVIIDGSADKLLKKIEALDKKISALTNKDKTVKLTAKDKASAIIAKVERAALKFANKTFRGMIAIRDSNALSTINKINNAASNLTRRTWQTVVTVTDKATAPLTKIRNMLFSIRSLAVAITAGLAANQLVAKPIALADAYSGAQIGFSTLLGEERGQQMMDDLDQFAKETPFGTSDVIAQTQRMLAMGWDAENIIEDMRVIGDAAAATGKGTQGLDQIVLALAQIKSKGKLSTEELNQLAEAGISAKRYLAEGLGYGSGDEGLMKLSKALESGEIYSDEALEAIMGGMKEYAGMMDATANETVEGLKSQIADAFEINIFRRWGQGLQDGAKKGLGSVVELLNTSEEGLANVGDMLYDLGSDISGFFADIAGNAISRINEISSTAEFQRASLGEKFGMLWEGVVSDPFSEWWENNREGFAKKAGEMGKNLGVAISDGIKGLLGVADIFDDTTLTAEGGASIAQSFAKGFVEGFDVSGIGEKIVDAISSVWGALPTWAKVLLGGYAAGKAVSGVGSVVSGAGALMGGASALKGAIGAAGAGGLLGAGTKAAASLGTGAAVGAGAASLLGLGGIAGGAVGGFSLLSGIADMISGNFTDDKVESKARTVSGGAKVGGALGGAALGAAIGSIIPGLGTAAGGLIGAGLGGILGNWGGGKLADSIRLDDEIEKEVTINLTPKVQTKMVNILRDDFGIPEEQAWSIVEKLTGVKKIENLVKVLGSEFGLKEEDAWDIVWEITGKKEIMNQISLTAADFGVKDRYDANVTIAATASIVGLPSDLTPKAYKKALGGVVGGPTIPGYASGGLTNSYGARLAMVGEEGPEMIIPLTSQRRNRALKLWAMAGHMMDVPGFARGGTTSGQQDEGIRFKSQGEQSSASSGNTEVNVGGISVQISVDASGSQNVAESIQRQSGEIAETIAGIMADALEAQFANTPTYGGA